MKQPRVPSPTNVRFDISTKRRLILLGDRMHLTASDIIRLAVAEKLPTWETDGVTIKPRG